MKILALALTPIFLIIAYIYHKDKYEREPLWLLFVTFMLGVLVSFPIILLQEKFSVVTQCDNTSNGIALFCYYFVGIAATEEMMKYLVVRVFIYPVKHFNEPFDGIVYFVVGALGFAALENILYIATAPNIIRTGVLRMVLSVPLHAVCGAAMGYFIGKAKFRPTYSWSIREHTTGLMAAIILHGTFDYLAAKEVGLLVLILLVIVGVFIVNRGMQNANKISPFRIRLHEHWQKLKANKYKTETQAHFILDEEIETIAASEEEDDLLSESENIV